MKSKTLKTLPVVLLLLFIVSTPVFPAVAVTIRGQVRALSLDENERLISVAIESPDGPFAVIPDAKGRKLYKLLGKEIKVKGVIGEDKFGRRAIRIRTFELIDRKKK